MEDSRIIELFFARDEKQYPKPTANTADTVTLSPTTYLP